jgi:hypothetical protein
MSSRASYAVNTSMPCLKLRHQDLQKWVPNLKKEDVAHISGGCIPCPCMALSGKKVVHMSNGTFVAVVGDVMYANCSDRSCTWMAKQKDDGSLEVEELLVEGSGAYGRPWVKYTEENYTKLGGDKLLGQLNKKAKPSE